MGHFGARAACEYAPTHVLGVKADSAEQAKSMEKALIEYYEPICNQKVG